MVAWEWLNFHLTLNCIIPLMFYGNSHEVRYGIWLLLSTRHTHRALLLPHRYKHAAVSAFPPTLCWHINDWVPRVWVWKTLGCIMQLWVSVAQLKCHLQVGEYLNSVAWISELTPADREFGCALLSAICTHLTTCHGCIIYYFCNGKDPRESVSQILGHPELSVQVAVIEGKIPRMYMIL